MNPLQDIRARFAKALETQHVELAPLLAMIRPAQDSRFGHFQANLAMPLGNQLQRPPREIAQELVEAVDLSGIASAVEVAGPGFINITLDDRYLAERLAVAMADTERIGVSKTETPETIVVDFSSPNVAKPMHVGHIRSTVIGDAIARTLRFLGHKVITDNHLGDWGTQFGMILYGYKHFLDTESWAAAPVPELTRLYRLVRKLIDFHAAAASIDEASALLDRQREVQSELLVAPEPENKADKKKLKTDRKSIAAKIETQSEHVAALQATLNEVENDPELKKLANAHPDIGHAVLQETARLHEGDEDNLALWREFLIHGRAEMEGVYGRLQISFDHELGESFYHDMLGTVVNELIQSGLARESEGAMCVFLDDHEAPMIVRKRDGAYLYATTDLATIRHRIATWNPDTILYVVDFRQGDHFEKLFNVARKWGYDNVDYRHVAFGTVMGENGKPLKTRAGDNVGLESLLDEAEERAFRVVSDLDDQKPVAEFNKEQRLTIAREVGISALKYADLSQNRSSDYTFSYDKMVNLKGNTATYLQYGYARVQGIFRRGETDAESVRAQAGPFTFVEDIERELAVKLLRFEEALVEAMSDFRPNLICNYLFELTQLFFVFFDRCPVLRETGELKQSRLQFCELTGRTLQRGLELLGIGVVDRM